MVPDFTRTSTGYWPRKPGEPLAQTVTFIYTDVILMRFAEVLLNYAEAVYELNGEITDAELNQSINVLRGINGVDMPDLTNAFVVANGMNILKKSEGREGLNWQEKDLGLMTLSDGRRLKQIFLRQCWALFSNRVLIQI